MAEQLKWWEKNPLPRSKLEELMKEGNYRPMGEMSPDNPNQRQYIKVSDKIAILLNNGVVGYYTITSLKAKYDHHSPVGRDECGVQVKGEMFCLDSGVNKDIRDVGYKVLQKFPWE